jgi:hypothetical protein
MRLRQRPAGMRGIERLVVLAEVLENVLDDIGLLDARDHAEGDVTLSAQRRRIVAAGARVSFA